MKISWNSTRRNEILRLREKAHRQSCSVSAMLACSSSPRLSASTFNYSSPTGKAHSQKKLKLVRCAARNAEDGREKDVFPIHRESSLRRRLMLLVSVSTGLFPASSAFGKAKGKNPFDERRLLEQNRRIQRENNVPEDFPNFVREGFEVKVVTPDNYITTPSGLVYRDIQVGQGDCPKDGQQVTFHYVGYNESGRRIDSTYLQGTPAKIRLGTNALVPGFEEGIRDMRPGGKRRIIIPPELGPPVGPSTFFSSKQFEVFDVELLSVQTCERRTVLGFYSDVVCN